MSCAGALSHRLSRGAGQGKIMTITPLRLTRTRSLRAIARGRRRPRATGLYHLCPAVSSLRPEARGPVGGPAPRKPDTHDSALETPGWRGNSLVRSIICNHSISSAAFSRWTHWHSLAPSVTIQGTTST